MTTRIQFFGVVILTAFCLLTSCEDVIEVDTPSEPPRLIVDGLIRVDTSSESTLASIKVSQTNGFFETIAPVGLEQITLTGLEAGGLNAILIETQPGSGIYQAQVPTSSLLAERIILQIDLQDEFYVAFAEFFPAPPIDNVEQGDGILFNEDDIEVKVTFTDLPEQDNFYVFDFDFGNYLPSEDTFYKDQQFEFSYFYDNLEPGDLVNVGILGADLDFYNYMNQLVEQSEDSGNPFQTPTLTVRGNLINATNIDNDDFFDNVQMEDNFALGYFAIVQQHTETLVIK